MKDNISIQHQLQPYIFAALYNLVIEMSFHIFLFTHCLIKNRTKIDSELQSSGSYRQKHMRYLFNKEGGVESLLNIAKQETY